MAAATGEPKFGYGLINISRRLRAQSDAESATAACLLRSAAHAIDKMVLGGSGLEGEPTGVVNAIGVTVVSGASLNYGTCVSAKASASAGGAPSGSWIAAPATRALLENRVRFANTETPIWDADRLASSPAFATPNAPAATLLCGFWPSVFILMFGGGVVIDRNPFDPTLFAAGILQLRVVVQLDVLLPLPASLVVLSAVS